MVTFQAYKWEVDEDETTTIYIHGLTIKGERVVVKIPDFKPFVYLELDPNKKWTNSKVEILRAYLKKTLHDSYPTKNKLVSRKKNYYYRDTKALLMFFNNKDSIRHLERLMSKEFQLFGVGKVKLTVHEQAASPVLQLFAMQKVTPSGWINAQQTRRKSLLEEFGDQFSNADIEIIASYSDISPAKSVDGIINPLILSYDIECVSHDATGNTFPNPKLPNDYIICISATVAYLEENEDVWRVYSLVNEGCNKKCPDLDDGAELRRFKNEKELLLGWSDFIKEINPDVIIGYNSLSFDDKYIFKRTSQLKCWPKFSDLGRIDGVRAKIDKRKWSSSAYGEQKFKFMDIPGRLHIDMYPAIFKEFTNLPSYTLNYVSEHFLGDHKIDLDPDEMIRKWHRGHPEDIHEIVTYCNKDTFLPLKLMQKLNTFIGLSEMANVVKVQPFDLITRGQQICVFSQVYCLAYEMGVICTSKWSDYKPTDAAKQFVGATVQNPKTGYWDKVPTFDFKSLYPTTIIAYNICFSTFITADENPEPGTYHHLKWDEHSGCEHDTAIRKSKVKKIICGSHDYRFYKAEVKKGMLPIILQGTLDARDKTRAEQAVLKKRLKDNYDNLSVVERKRLELMITVLEQRQLKYKTAGNSMYGGLGSDYSYTPFYEAAASTTAMGRKSIQDAIDYAMDYRKDTVLVYGDTDSCMLHFSSIKTLEECFEVSEELEKQINAIFPKPMYLELEKIYGKYFLLSKKRYVGYIVNKKGDLTMIDKKGVVIKRRDNCGYLKEIYSHIIDMVMAKEPRWRMYDYLKGKIDDLLVGNVALEKLVITKSIKDTYKAKNLPHVRVAEKMRSRGKYVATGTRIRYIFTETDGKNDPQYVKAEDPDYYLKNKETIKIDYLYYLEKQLVNPIDEVFEVRFKKNDILKNLLKLIKRGKITSAKEYFEPKFVIE